MHKHFPGTETVDSTIIDSSNWRGGSWREGCHIFRAYHGIRNNPAQDGRTSPFIEQVDFPFDLRGIMEEGKADPRRRPSGR
jgi:hypothetical protein